MKKLITILCITLLITSCADQQKRYQYLKRIYPKCKVEPATGIIQSQGFEFIVIDTSMQIIAVQFYPASETKIMQFRNIR
jgi:hypothetical protein